MSATVITESTAFTQGSAQPGELRVHTGHYGITHVLAMEWTKLRTVRSTWLSVLAIAVVGLVVGVLVSWGAASHWSSGESPQDLLSVKLGFDPTSYSLFGLELAQLVIGVLGVLVISAEYGTGTIRSTLAAVPNRPLVLTGKVVVFGVLAVVLGQALAFGSFFLGQVTIAGAGVPTRPQDLARMRAIAGSFGAFGGSLPRYVFAVLPPHATLGQPGVLRAVVGSGLYFAVMGLFALAIGAIVRHTAGAIATYVGISFILPLLAFALPSTWRNEITRFIPDTIGRAMSRTVPANPAEGLGHAFTPWVGLGVLCTYVVVSLVIAGVLLVRRDA